MLFLSRLIEGGAGAALTKTKVVRGAPLYYYTPLNTISFLKKEKSNFISTNCNPFCFKKSNTNLSTSLKPIAFLIYATTML